MSIQQLTAAIFHRPVRVAWLVAESRVSGDAGLPILSDLAQECCRRWEGRNSILIPFSEDTFSETSRLLLKHHDPDEIIALDRIPPAVIEEIDELVHVLAFHSKNRGAEAISALDFQVQSVAALPTHASLERRDTSFFNRDAAELLLFAFTESCPPEVRHCVTLNFGTYAHVIRQDGSADFGLARDLWRDLPHREYVLGTVSDFAAALDELAGDRQRPAVQFVAPMQLAEGRDDVKHRWPSDERYQVFIGDSFEDAALFWHQPLCDGSWQLCSQFRFYLPESLAKHAVFRISVQKWLRRFTNAGGSLHKAPLFISNSLSKAGIGAIANELLQDNPFSISSAEAEQRQLLVPAEDYETRPPVLLGVLESASNTELCRVSFPSDQVSVGRPDAVAAGAISPRWMADILLEMPPPPELARGKRSTWRMPAMRSQDLVSRMFRGGCRVQRTGCPSVQLSGMRPTIGITQPHAYYVFEMLLRGQRSSYLTTDLRRQLPQRGSTKFSIAVSDKGQRYRAAVDLFGGFAVAAQYLESVLWRSIFRQLASEKPTADATLRENIISVLRKEIPRSDAPERERAAQRVVGKIQGRTKEVHMTFRQFAKHLASLRRGPRPFPVGQRIRENSVYHDASEWPHDCGSLRTDLTNLMSRGVIEVGLEWSCHRCGSAFWVSLRLAAQHNECPQCEASWNVDAEMPWSYRLAPLIRSAFQQSGGGMPVLLAVNNLHAESVESFLWHPNIDIYRPDYEDGKRPWHELDIVALVDGKLTVGEVKNAFSDFDESDFTSLREVCEAITPDVALLVFLEGDYNPTSSFAQRFTTLASLLRPKTTLEWRKLPSGW